MYRSIIAALVLATAAVPAARAEDASGALTVQLSGLEPRGAVMIQIFTSEAAYDSGDAAGVQQIVVDGDTEEARFEGLAPGQYAVRLFHDVNNDGRMNTNPFGIPTEPFAFSNNARGSFGPASWSQAVFALNAGENTQAITVGGGQ